jgi:phosphoribosylaminoimidazole (AIR) synthetase
MYQVFNMGIGMTIVCSPHQAARVMSALPQAKAIGEIIKAGDKERVILD